MAGEGRHRGQPPQPDGFAIELTYLPLLLVSVAYGETGGAYSNLDLGGASASTYAETGGVYSNLDLGGVEVLSVFLAEPIEVIVGIEATLETGPAFEATIPVVVGIVATLTSYGGLEATVPITVAIYARLTSRTTEAVNGILGCGVYEIIFFERGGVVPVGSLPFASLGWGRVLDGVSEATMTLTGLMGSNASCCGVVASLRPWQHEMAFYRDNRRVWAGPVTEVDVEGETVQVTARDLGQWLYRRRLRRDHSFTYTDLATIFQAYVDDALAVDNSMGLYVTSSPSGVVGSRDTLALQHLIAGDEIDELTRTGVDWTVVDRTAYVGGSKVPVPVPTTGSLLLIDDSFMTPPRVVIDGLAQANDWLVRGAGVGDGPDVVYGEASSGASRTTYGWLDQVTSEDAILDNTSATVAAQTRLALTGTPPFVVSDGVLAPGAGVTIDLLVPGQLIELRLVEACLPVTTQYRLSSVNVSVSTAQDEQVVVGFQPVGTVGVS